ncbi:MAG: hypothetical protein LBD13_01580 [Spirochaetaceae bacterium]|jgi:hypothetical protein|nr:hypothetical protein [Spirochaetaceae bacterium]
MEKLKNKFRFFGIAALAAVIGFALAGCDADAKGDGGYKFEFKVQNNSTYPITTIQFYNGREADSPVVLTGQTNLAPGATSAVYKPSGFTVQAATETTRTFGVKFTMSGGGGTRSFYQSGGDGEKMLLTFTGSSMTVSPGTW